MSDGLLTWPSSISGRTICGNNAGIYCCRISCLSPETRMRILIWTSDNWRLSLFCFEFWPNHLYRKWGQRLANHSKSTYWGNDNEFAAYPHWGPWPYICEAGRTVEQIAWRGIRDQCCSGLYADIESVHWVEVIHIPMDHRIDKIAIRNRSCCLVH